MRFKSLNRSNLVLFTVSLIYLLICIILINHYQYETGNDLISYINIACLYLEGDIPNAINGYWSPLLSWIVLPFLWIYGSSPLNALYAYHISQIVIGLFTLIGAFFLSSRLRLNDVWRTLVLLSVLPFIICLALTSVQPDFLLICILLFYFYVIFDEDYPKNLSHGVVCGVLGSITYMTKSYALFFFLGHFTIFNILHYFNNFTSIDKKRTVTNFFVGLVVFLVISGLWVGVISTKYNDFTYSTSSKFNHAILGPESPGHPTSWPGLITPPYQKAVSAWDDPSLLKVESWNPFESINHILYQLSLIKKNLIDLIGIYISFTILSLIIIPVGIILSIMSLKKPLNWKKILKQKELIYLLTTILIYPMGYLVLTLEARYVWIVYILLLLMGLNILKQLFQKKYFTKSCKIVLTTLLIVSFLILPINGIIYYYDMDKSLVDISNGLKEIHPIHGNIASNGNMRNGGYKQSLYLSYYLESRYYGFTDDISGLELKKQLDNHEINYYILWENYYADPQLVSGNYPEITEGRIEGLKIYSIKG